MHLHASMQQPQQPLSSLPRTLCQSQLEGLLHRFYIYLLRNTQLKKVTKYSMKIK